MWGWSLLVVNGIIRTVKQLPEVARTAVWGKAALCMAGAYCDWLGGNIEKVRSGYPADLCGGGLLERGTMTYTLLWMRSVILRPGCRGQRWGKYWGMWGCGPAGGQWDDQDGKATAVSVKNSDSSFARASDHA